jgi:hypothetical protein
MSAAQRGAAASPAATPRATWTPRRIVSLLLIGPAAAVLFGLAVQIVNPGWMTDASYGATVPVVIAPQHIAPLPDGR